MQINKKFLLITLSISLHGAVMGMETKMEIQEAWTMVNTLKKQANKEAKEQAQLILNFTKDSNENSTNNRQNMESVGTWLTEQRKNFPKKEWKSLVKKLNSGVSMEIARCLCPETNKRFAVIKIIEEIAYPLKPGEDCSQLLADRIEAKLKTITK